MKWIRLLVFTQLKRIYQNNKFELRRLLESVNQTKMQLGESFSSKEISVQPNKANYIALYMLLVIVGRVWRELVSNRKVKNTIVLF